MALTWPSFGRIVVSKALSYWIEHGGLSAFTDSSEASPVRGHKATMVFQRQTEAPSSTRDLMMTSVYFVSPESVFDGSRWFDSGEMDAVDTACQDLWTQVRGNYSSGVQLLEIRHFHAGSEIASPDPSLGTNADGRPKQAPNPSVRVTHLTQPGTHGGTSPLLPPQVACTVTLATASRKHWGRMYLPGPVIDSVDDIAARQGRYRTVFVDAVSNGFQVFMTGAASAGVYPVVWSPTSLSFLSIDNIHVDDVPDVQRRRRFATTGYVKQHGAGG